MENQASYTLNWLHHLAEHTGEGTRWGAFRPYQGYWDEFPLSELTAEQLVTEENIYFSVFEFDGSRKKVNALSIRLLWADYDQGIDKYTKAVNDASIPQASYLWNTSPGRYQALWFLDESMSPELAEARSKALQALTNSDEVWDSARMLRVPCTLHRKSEEVIFRGEMVNRSGAVYNIQRFCEEVRSAEGEAVAETIIPEYIPEPDIESMPIEVQKLLLASSATGQRHRKLYYMACMMAEAGVDAGLAIANMRASVWNKFSGRKDELNILADIYKKATISTGVTVAEAEGDNATGEVSISPSADVATVIVNDEHSFEIVNYQHMLGLHHQDDEWLVDNWWPMSAKGIVGGSPKSFKSTLLLDMCMSIASGVPFLGNPVRKIGPILMFQEENDPLYIAELMRRMAVFKGLGVSVEKTEKGDIAFHNAVDLPIYIASYSGLDLTQKNHQLVLRKLVEKFQPVMVVLDSLYKFLGNASEESNTEIRPVLGGLDVIRAETDAAIAIIHHKRKSTAHKATRSGEELRGAGSFHAWEEVGWYIDRVSDTKDIVSIKREFRAAPAAEQIKLTVAQVMRRYALVEGTKPGVLVKELFDFGEIISMRKFQEQIERYIDPAVFPAIVDWMQNDYGIEFIE